MKRSMTVVFPVFSLVIAVFFAACSGGGGGAAGGGPAETTANSVVTAVHNAAPSSACPNGGIQVDAGIDRNGNGVLDPAEITSTQNVCNGANGTNGLNGNDGSTVLVLVTNEPAGAHCAAGGKKVSVGADTNKSSVLDASEITSSDYICNGLAGPTNTYGTVTGVVKSTTGSELPGVLVSNSLTDETATTGSDGSFTLTLPAGSYSLTFIKNYYTTAMAAANVAIGITTTVNATLAEAGSGRPSISLAASGSPAGYGATVNLTATASDPNGGNLTYTWSGATGSGSNATTTTPTLAESFAYRPDPMNPGGYINPPHVEDRFGVLPISPDTWGAKTVSVTVNDGQGQSTTQSIKVYAAGIQSGLRTVPLGVRLYLNSGHNGANAWSMTTAPNLSTAVFDDPASRYAFFVPDLQGMYTVSEGGNSMDIYASEWMGAISGGSGNDITIDPTCLICHNNGIASDEFTPWKATRHATVFTRGINGLISTDATCVACHTVGYDPFSVNNGFDDAATAAGWTYPAVLQSSNWETMLSTAPGAARRANVQCENCHGPNYAMGVQGSHGKTLETGSDTPLNERISYGVEVCAQCHASGSNHHIVSEWATLSPDGTGHSSLEGARMSAVGGSIAYNCGRCHSAQGFVQFVGQLKDGNMGYLQSSVTNSYSVNNIEPITCAACHDPHDATNPAQLRFYGDSPKLPSGFAVYGLGKGALCVACHNSRNGAQSGSSTLTYLHEDGETYNAGNPLGYTIPHQSTQGDVLMGRNAYFMGGSLPMISKHANVTDSCVGCHMTQNPQKHAVNGELRANKHAMYIGDEDVAAFCTGCHNATNGEALMAGTENLLALLQSKMGVAIMTKVNALGTIKVRAWDPETDQYSSTTSSNSNVTLDLAANPIVSVVVVESHGQMTALITLTNPVDIPYPTPKNTDTFGVQLGSLKDNANAVVYSLSGNLIRAGWNYILIQYDGSKGIHNPTFVNEVLTKTLAKDLSN